MDRHADRARSLEVQGLTRLRRRMMRHSVRKGQIRSERAASTMVVKITAVVANLGTATETTT